MKKQRIQIKNLGGETFGRLQVLEYVGNDKHNKALWSCICECGNLTIVNAASLLKGLTKSCGCLRKEKVTEQNTKHGLRYHPLYRLWLQIKVRCYYKGDYPTQKNYRDRGISICSQWLNNPKKFIADCIEMGWKPGLEIDRINNNGNYEPENIRFVKRNINVANRRAYGATPYAGISYYTRHKYWLAQVHWNNKRIFVKASKNLNTVLIERDLFVLTNNLPHTLNILKRP